MDGIRYGINYVKNRIENDAPRQSCISVHMKISYFEYCPITEDEICVKVPAEYVIRKEISHFD